MVDLKRCAVRIQEAEENVHETVGHTEPLEGIGSHLNTSDGGGSPRSNILPTRKAREEESFDGCVVRVEHSTAIWIESFDETMLKIEDKGVRVAVGHRVRMKSEIGHRKPLALLPALRQFLTESGREPQFHRLTRPSDDDSGAHVQFQLIPSRSSRTPLCHTPPHEDLSTSACIYAESEIGNAREFAERSVRRSQEGKERENVRIELIVTSCFTLHPLFRAT